MRLRWLCVLLALLAAQHALAFEWAPSQNRVKPGEYAIGTVVASDGTGDKTPLDARECGLASIAFELTAGTLTLELYLVEHGAVVSTNGTLVASFTGDTRIPLPVSIGAYDLLPKVAATASGAGYATVRCDRLGGGASSIPFSRASYQGMKACLESAQTVDCYVSGEFALPAGANTIAWRTFNATRGTPASGMLNGRDRKTLHCLGGQWYGTDDAVTDAATLTFDFSAIEHDADLVIEGCGINGTLSDNEPVLRLEHLTGVSGSNLVRVRFVNVDFNENGIPLGSTITTTATFAAALIQFENCWFNIGGPTTTAPTIRFLGAMAGSSGQGGRVYISDTLIVLNGTNGPPYAFWDSTGDASTGLTPIEFLISNSQFHGGVAGYAADTTPTQIRSSAMFHFGVNDMASVQLANAKFYLSQAGAQTGSLFRWTYTGTGVPMVLKGALSIRILNSAVLGSIYGIADAGKGPNNVDLRIDVGGTGGVRSIAYADTGATVNARQLDVSVIGRQNLPSGVDLPSIFDRTFIDKLASEAIANGELQLNGKRIAVVNGMIGSTSGSYFLARTFNVLALNSDTSLYAVPATPTPLVITRASCITEDATGSAVFTLWKNSFAGNPLAAAPQACSYRLTDAAADACPTCTGGVDQTATLTQTPDDQSIICSSTTPATSFQIDAAGALRNPTNINHAYKTVDATTITWQPTATVTADLTCTYQTKPVWQTQGNGNNTFATAADILGIRAGAGFGASGKTRVMIEATPQF